MGVILKRLAKGLLSFGMLQDLQGITLFQYLMSAVNEAAERDHPMVWSVISLTVPNCILTSSVRK